MELEPLSITQTGRCLVAVAVTQTATSQSTSLSGADDHGRTHDSKGRSLSQDARHGSPRLEDVCRGISVQPTPKSPTRSCNHLLTLLFPAKPVRAKVCFSAPRYSVVRFHIVDGDFTGSELAWKHTVNAEECHCRPVPYAPRLFDPKN